MERNWQNRVFGFLAWWVLLLNTLELTLSENGVRSKYFHDLFLVEQKLLTSGMRHAPSGLCVIECYGSVPRKVLGFAHFIFLCLGYFDQRRDVFVESHQVVRTAWPFGKTKSCPIILTRHIWRSTTGSPISGSQIQLPLQIFIRTFDLLVLRLIKLCLSLTFFNLLLKELDSCLRIFIGFLINKGRLYIIRVVFCFGVLHILVSAHLLSSEAIRIISRRIINFNTCRWNIIRNSRWLFHGCWRWCDPIIGVVVEPEHQVVVFWE